MKNDGQKGLINRLHLIYMIICSSIVILAILAMTIWQREGASTGLNNAATASSIVLAVVAIVMTIVDIAGQRKTVLELKETAEKLESNLIQTNKNLEIVGSLENQLVDHMQATQKSYDEIVKKISILQKQYESEGKENVVEDLEKLKDNLIVQTIGRVRLSPIEHSIVDKREFRSVRFMIRTLLQQRSELTLPEISEHINVSLLGKSRSYLKKVISYMVDSGELKNENGKYSLNAHIKTEHLP